MKRLPSIFLIVYFLTFFGFVQSGILIKLNKDHEAIFDIQVFFLLIICIKSYAVLEAFAMEKEKITVLRIESESRAGGYFHRIFKTYRSHFIALTIENREARFSKFTRRHELREGQELRIYGDINGNVVVIDKYAIWYNILGTIELILLYIILMPLYAHFVITQIYRPA